MSPQTTRFDLQGYTLPLNYTPDHGSIYRRFMFPNALDPKDISNGFADQIYVHREVLMMQVMNSITDKPEWEHKVFDNDIVAKWREEITASGQDITPKMMAWIIDELRWKAGRYGETGHVVAYSTGVVKSDSAIPLELKESLREAVRSLEDVPEEKKDYHPGSDKKVVDLVHPSLFPVIYGRSRILPDRVIGIDDCLESVGQGQQLPVPAKEQAGNDQPASYYRFRKGWNPYSLKFQWMPCDVEFTEASGCRVTSYINNLHPENRSLYEVIEKILAKTIPLWNTTLSHVRDAFNQRIPYQCVEYDYQDPEPQYPDDSDDDEVDDYCKRYDEWENSGQLRLPEPGTFTPPLPNPKDVVDLRSQYAKEGLQVIVKLANIELTPEKPEYNGGSWHAEGQSNEHICATALYYYSSENITENHLSFRKSSSYIHATNYNQDQHAFLQQVFGFPPETKGQGKTNVTQILGSVSTCEDRLLTFPNILQHRVSPFSLADKSKPGHRKILAFFLVDPHMRVISSANIPPQNEEWWNERREVMDKVLGRRLPVELQDMVNDNVDASPITMDKAKQYRLELMEERSSVKVEQNNQFEIGDFNLCEH